MDKSSWLSRCSLSFINLTLILFSVNLHAFQQTTNELTLSALADLSTITLNNDKWQSVLPVIGSNSEYFLASKNGKVYLLNNEKATTTAILDLTRHFNNKTIHGLTAIAIDPSFAYRDRNGYNTFYTAHIEETTSSNKTSNNKLDISAGSNSTRNTDSYTDKNLPYDTVITRWQLSSSQHQPSTVSQFHEVLRIPIQKTNEAIRQLSFNPYTESWHEDFGLLYVLLSKTDNEEMSEKALYSGTVLRIKPERFGLQSYTIPLNNPFMRNADIRNEIVIMTGANIINFDWLKNGKTRLLLQLDSVEQNTLIQAKLGDDFRNNLPPVSEQAKITKQASDTSNKVILYQGRELKNLWGKVLQLNNVDKNWQLQALSLTPNTEPPFSVTANFANLAHSNGEKLSLHRHSNNELLVLAHNQQLLYSISAAPKEIVPTTATVQTPASNKGNSHLLLILLIIFASLSSYLWYVKFRAGKKQHFLHSQWANFDVNTATKSLSLYKRHEKSVGKIVNISTLKNSEILLNDEVISVISADPQQGFSNSLEEQVLNYFAKEHRLKMVNDKQRKIQLRLTDTTEASFMFCLYYRVGNIRHTKLKYHKVLDKVIDWNWLFSQFINAEHTSKRKIRVKIKPKVKLNSSQNTAELNQQAGSQPPINQNQESNTPVKPLKQSSTTEADIVINQDTELVTALDKLVAMKKQGFLSEDEFNIAKTKIINDLMK